MKTVVWVNCGRCGKQHIEGGCAGMLGNGFGGDAGSRKPNPAGK